MATTDPTNDELRVLLDKQAITEVLHRYCIALDRKDREMGYSVWHPDGTAKYEGMFEGTGHEFIDFGIGGHETALPVSSHQLTNIVIEVEGDHASSVSYVTAASSMAGTDRVYFIKGQYHDTWSRRDGVWRIAERRFATDLWYLAPLNHDLMPAMESPA
jgi:hypothetical protein